MAKAMAKTKAKTLTAYDRVKIARDAKRPHIFDFIKALCSDFEELHGDRLVNDDRGLVGGFATLGGKDGSSGSPEPLPKDAFRVLILGHNKGALPCEARREVSSARRDVRRHARRVSRPRGRGARSGRGDRQEP